MERKMKTLRKPAFKSDNQISLPIRAATSLVRHEKGSSAAHSQACRRGRSTGTRQKFSGFKHSAFSTLFSCFTVLQTYLSKKKGCSAKHHAKHNIASTHGGGGATTWCLAMVVHLFVFDTRFQNGRKTGQPETR
jgi:hypothetical protein